MESAEQSTRALYTGVSNNLIQAGHPATPRSVNPHDQSPLEEIHQRLGDATHLAESTFEEVVSGASSTTNVRTMPSKPGLRGVMDRVLKKAA